MTLLRAIPKEISLIKGSRKKVLFLVAWPLTPLAPNPLGLVAIVFFPLPLKKFLFSLVPPPFPPPPPAPLSGPATKK